MTIQNLSAHMEKQDIDKLDHIIAAADFGDQILFHGNMFDLKSGALTYCHHQLKEILKRIHLANTGLDTLPQDVIIACKPSFDQGRRDGDKDHIVSATGAMIPAHIVDTGEQLEKLVTENTRVIIGDEHHFTNISLYKKIQEYRKREHNPILALLAGLTYTYDKTIPFPIMLPTSPEANYSNIADSIAASEMNMLEVAYDSTFAVKMQKSKCSECDKPAKWSQRWVNDKPAPKGHALYILGSNQDSKHKDEKINYTAACDDCYHAPE